jgi:hypothetical protein
LWSPQTPLRPSVVGVLGGKIDVLTFLFCRRLHGACLRARGFGDERDRPDARQCLRNWTDNDVGIARGFSVPVALSGGRRECRRCGC